MKSLAPLSFDSAQCRKDLDRFKALLDSKLELSERDDLVPLFRECVHLTAFIGTQVPEVGPANRVANEFQILGDFAADIVIGNSTVQTYCAIELEDAKPDSIFRRAGSKATTEWGQRFEHGFGQIVDWFFLWDDHKSTTSLTKHFGHGHVDYYGLLLIGRSEFVSDLDRNRLRWRSSKVMVNSHKIFCRTYDELYESLEREWQSRVSSSVAGS